MPNTRALTDKQLSDVAEFALRKQLSKQDLDHVEVRSGLDHDGDEALFVTAVVGGHVGGLSGDTLARAHEALANGLRDKGEQRFPYFKLRRLGEEPADEALPVSVS